MTCFTWVIANHGNIGGFCGQWVDMAALLMPSLVLLIDNLTMLAGAQNDNEVGAGTVGPLFSEGLSSRQAKVRAAEELGISRTTLYAKMRALRITEY